MQDYYTNGQVVLNFESGEEVNLHSGVLKAYIDSLNGNGVYATGRQNGEHGIAYYKSAIDVFARTLADTFNAANGADDDPARQMFVGYPSGGKDPTAGQYPRFHRVEREPHDDRYGKVHRPRYRRTALRL